MKSCVKVCAATAIATLAIAAVSPSPAFADRARDSQWHLKTLAVSQAHAISTGSGVTVAVADTGIYPHPDLRKNLVAGIDEIAPSGGNGQKDEAGHGTGMASLIAAHGRSSADGIQGIAPSAKIMPVRIAKKESGISVSDMAKGIAWANSQGAEVINVSAGAGPAFELIDAVGSALDNEVIVVAAIGNSSKGAIASYPAAIDGVLAVGATGRNGQYSDVSVKSSKVQICAPGVDITTAQPSKKYVVSDGTSGASAIVSGAAALVRAKYPQLSAEDVVHRLTATADDIGPPGRDDECGFGRLNIVKALTADVPPLGTTTAPSAAVTTSAAAPSPGPSDEVAAPQEPASSSTPLLLGGLAGLVIAGALVAVLALRHRRS